MPRSPFSLEVSNAACTDAHAICTDWLELTSERLDAPEFYEKPKIVQKDNVIIIKARAKSHTGEMKAEWFKVCFCPANGISRTLVCRMTNRSRARTA